MPGWTTIPARTLSQTPSHAQYHPITTIPCPPLCKRFSSSQESQNRRNPQNIRNLRILASQEPRECQEPQDTHETQEPVLAWEREAHCMEHRCACIRNSLGRVSKRASARRACLPANGSIKPVAGAQQTGVRKEEAGSNRQLTSKKQAASKQPASSKQATSKQQARHRETSSQQPSNQQATSKESASSKQGTKKQQASK